MRPWILSETNYSQVKDGGYRVAVLPMGATEPHNLHLPYGTDTYQVDEIARRACEAAWKRDARVVMLPPIPYGTETNQAAFPLSMNLYPSTIALIIRDLLESLANSDVDRVLILNGHGGNSFKPLLREMMNQTPCHLFLCDWFGTITRDVQGEIFDDPGDHAGEMETSMGLAFFPDLVDRDHDGNLNADDGSIRLTRFDAVNRNWISISRKWDLLTSNSGAGNPHPASAEKGRRLMEVLVERLSDFLVELATSSVDSEFPFRCQN